jgi:nitroreductase
MIKLMSATESATMSARDAIYARRSVRAYTSKPVEHETIEALIDAAIQAPTAVHEEPWAFAVVQDRKLLRRLSDSAKERLRERVKEAPAAARPFVLPENVFYDAGTLIVIYGKPLGPFVAADCWLAAENLMLAARERGLGTCVIGLSVAALDSAEWKARLGVPPELTAYAPIIVGTPAEEVPPTGRRAPEILCWKNGLSGAA